MTTDDGMADGMGVLHVSLCILVGSDLASASLGSDVSQVLSMGGAMYAACVAARACKPYLARHACFAYIIMWGG